MYSKYRRIVRAVYGAYWAIQQEKLEAIVDFLELKTQGLMFTPEEIRARIGRGEGVAQKDNAPSYYAFGGDSISAASGSPSGSSGVVAVLPLRGIIAQRVSMMDDISGPGGASTEQFGRMFRSAMSDPNVKAIMIDVDSPGGTVYGVQELADEIRSARGKKPVVAMVNSLAASAAYWIASAADELVVTPSGEVGSIGVYSVHTDISKLEELEGVKTTMISAGKFKVEGNPYEPLADDARAYIQTRVEDYNATFVKAVAKGRGTTAANVNKTFGEGRVFGANKALEVGMVDSVATYEETLSRLVKGKSKASASASSHTEISFLSAEEMSQLTNFSTDEIIRALDAKEAAPEAKEPDPKIDRTRERERIKLL